MEVFTLRDLTFTYPGQTTPALSGLNLTVERGEFLTLFGPSGCGKTTLLRQLKPALTPHGTRQGQVLFRGKPLEDWDRRTQTAAIGFVLQSPEEQIVTDKVWHELAFGLESLGLPQGVIRARVAEMAAFFGFEDWFHRDTASLSGGQKQLLNLAAAMVMGPEVLLLDEPTSQLDPIAAQTFLDCLARLNRELGTTILLSEHRLEEALPLSHRCALLEGGRLLTCAPPREAGAFLLASRHPMFASLPTPMRVWAAAGGDPPCPLTCGEGRHWLEDVLETHTPAPLSAPTPPPLGEAVLEAKEVWFRYDREGRDVLRGLSLSVPAGSLFALLGGNGAGKSTLLSLLSGVQKPQRGSLSLLGRPLDQWEEGALFHGALALLPQDPKSLFVGRTVAQELADITADPQELGRVAGLCRLEALLSRHPYDLSGGEQQRLALAKVLLTRPQVLLLDEPTKGMDVPFQETFAAILEGLCREGVTVVMVSHDVEFCARHAHRCALMFDGGITAEGTPAQFFPQNRFYTTAACRMAGDQLPGVVTTGDLIAALGGTPEPEAGPTMPAPQAFPISPQAPKKSPVRPLGVLALLLVLGAGWLAWRGVPLLAGLAAGNWLPSLAWLGVAALALWLLGLGRARPETAPHLPPSPKGKPLLLTALCLLVLVPLTLLAGTYLLGDRKYYFISLLLLLEALAPMFLAFEAGKPRSRELVILALLTALAAAGRAAFFMLPQFKPVAAVVILAGTAFGGQAGFLVGAASMLVSNFFYVQGAWTPWQMAAMGLLGLLAGWLAPLLARNRLALVLYGFLAPILLYGGLMNPASVLMYQPHPTWEMVLSSWLLGLPLDLVHGAATAFFLWAAGPGLLDKLERIKVKYGLSSPR